MIFGRPTNLVLGAFTAISGAVVVILANLQPPIIIPGAVVGGVGVAFGALIALIANQPPTVNPGDTVTVQTPSGEANKSVTV